MAFVGRPRTPKTSKGLLALLIACATITSATFGYDGSMMNGLNIIPPYLDYFHINNTTLGLSTSAIYIGGILAAATYPYVLNRVSRRTAMLLASLFTLIFVGLQAGAVNIAMFTAARIGIGWGKACSAMAAPIYLAETLPYKHRGWGLGLVCDFYYVGALIAAGITYRTLTMDSIWAWRLPSLLQGFWSLLCIAILPFVPESPRWLIFHGRQAEAKTALALLGADGDESDPLVSAQYQEILDTIEFEKKDESKQLSLKQTFKTKGARWRVSLGMSCALATVICGNQIASYYLGPMLTNAGISDPQTQLQINVILNAWNLVCSLAGTYFASRIGRRLDALVSTIALTIFLYLIGAFTKIYGGSDNTAGVYGTVAFIFLFMGAYSFGWTPLTYLYPPEVLNYTLRTYGMGLTIFTMYSVGLVLVFTIPFALDAMGWKVYMMNASWNVLLIAFIWFCWVETKGKTLEELDEIFEGEKHSDVINASVLESQIKTALEKNED